MKRVLEPERRAAIAERLRFYRDLGVYDFYRRAVPPGRRRIRRAGPGVRKCPGSSKSNERSAANASSWDETAASEPMKKTVVLTKPAGLAAVREDLGDCTRCPLHRLGRKQIVFGVGNPDAQLMFVGEGPGADEDAQGEPFVGRAGQLLNNMISAMGLRREDVYIANVVKCRPPQNRTPEREECETCSPFLMRQIAVVRPKIIVALGAVAAKTLLGINDSMAKLRGRIYDFSPALPKDAPERRAPAPEVALNRKGLFGRGVHDQARRNLSSRLPSARSAAEERSLAGLADGDALSRTYRPRQERRARLSRMSEQFCDVALPLPLDTTFTYKVDGAPVIAGGRVIVPFREKRMQGIVLRLHDQPPSRKLKSVIAALDSVPVLDDSLLTLGAWIARYYLAPLGEVYRSMLPLAAEFKQVIAYRITERGTEALYESAAVGSSKRSHLDPERQMAEYAVLDYLAEGELVREATLRSSTGATREMLRNLVAKKWIAREDISSRARRPANDQDRQLENRRLERR